MPENNLTFEAALGQLENISQKLESGTVSLDEAISLFEEGMKLTKFCSDKLSVAKQKIVLLSEAESEENDD